VGRGFLFIFLFLLLIHGSSHNKNKNKLLRKQKIAENATRENRNKNLALQKIVGWVQKKNTKQKQNHTEQTKENQPQKRHSNMTKIKTKTHKLACIWLHMNEADVMGNVEKFWLWQISERFRYSRSLRLPLCQVNLWSNPRSCNYPASSASSVCFSTFCQLARVWVTMHL